MEDVMEGGYEDMYAEEAQPMKKGVLEQVKLFQYGFKTDNYPLDQNRF